MIPVLQGIVYDLGAVNVEQDWAWRLSWYCCRHL